MGKTTKAHKDLEFAVDDASGQERNFKTFAEAAAFAIGIAATGRKAKLDVLCYSEAGAKWWGGDDAVEQYREDPDASVFERIEVSVNLMGRVP